jgi:hypothetical protein
MKLKRSKLFLGSLLLINSTGSVAGLLLSSDLLDYSAIAGAAITIEAKAAVSNDLAAKAGVGIGANSTTGNIYAGAAAVIGAGSTVANIYAGGAAGIAANATAVDITQALSQVLSAQISLRDLTEDFSLPTTMGSETFVPGVYAGTALATDASSTITLDGLNEDNPFWIFNLSNAMSVGAGNLFEITNAGAGASVIWNIGGALTLGAKTSFIGSVLANGAISGGAGSGISCGNLFSIAAIGIGSVTSTNCIGSNNWDGSINGLADGFGIFDGVPVNGISRSIKSIPEPSTAFLMSALLFMLLPLKFKRKSGSKVN